MNATERDQADCVVAVCKCGSAVIMAVSEFISDETKADLGDATANGCDIKHMAAADVRKMNFGCKCENSGSTLDLFSQQIAA